MTVMNIKAGLYLAAAGLAVLAAAPTAGAQQACAPHEDLVKYLAQNYQEQQQARGLSSNGSLVEVYLSAQGSWTMIASSPDGTSCVIAAGESWEQTEDPDRIGTGANFKPAGSSDGERESRHAQLQPDAR